MAEIRDKVEILHACDRCNGSETVANYWGEADDCPDCTRPQTEEEWPDEISVARRIVDEDLGVTMLEALPIGPHFAVWDDALATCRYVRSPQAEETSKLSPQHDDESIEPKSCAQAEELLERFKKLPPLDSKQFLEDIGRGPQPDVGELVEAAETLASYTQGFSENRAVAEAKEVVERHRAALARYKEGSPDA